MLTLGAEMGREFGLGLHTAANVGPSLALNSQLPPIPTAVAAVAQLMVGLHELHLERNNIGDEGGEKLAEGLKGAIELETLRVGFNSIDGSRAAKRLASAVLQSRSLKDFSHIPVRSLDRDGSLHLLNKGIGEPGAYVLAALMPSANHLKTLDLSLNGIRAAGAACLAQSLEGNTTLTQLTLLDNELAQHDFETLSHVFDTNQCALQSVAFRSYRDDASRSYVDVTWTPRRRLHDVRTAFAE